jgi:hypothetical protein
VLASARRHRECTAAAELQQDLLPPRIGRLEGAEVAGSILPAYDVGGDWIDHCAMAGGGWLGVADAVGKGPQASAIGAIALGAYRAARRGGCDVVTAAVDIHEAICALEVKDIFMSAVLAAWDAPSSSLSWLRCGHPPPMVWHARRGLRALQGGDGPVLGLDRLHPAREPGWAKIARDETRRPRLRRRARARRPGARRLRRGRAGARAGGDAGAVGHRGRVRGAAGRRMVHDGPLRDDASVLVLAPR